MKRHKNTITLHKYTCTYTDHFSSSNPPLRKLTTLVLVNYNVNNYCILVTLSSLNTNLSIRLGVFKAIDVDALNTPRLIERIGIRDEIVTRMLYFIL